MFTFNREKAKIAQNWLRAIEHLKKYFMKLTFERFALLNKLLYRVNGLTGLYTVCHYMCHPDAKHVELSSVQCSQNIHHVQLTVKSLTSSSSIIYFLIFFKHYAKNIVELRTLFKKIKLL